jgi:hypothetical protein
VDPRIIDKGAIILAGMAFHGDPFQSAEGWSQSDEIGKLWKRFSPLGCEARSDPGRRRSECGIRDPHRARGVC